ncbi:MAG: YndJ family transporter [Saprospiraceae bacterium]
MKTSLRLPNSARLAAFLEKEKTQAFTYSEVGRTADTEACVEGFDHDAQCVVVGRGLADFERARQALREWAHFPPAWTRILPGQAPLSAGNTVAMFFRLFGLWWHNSCRIVYAVEEPRRFGFAYGTLPAHLERGEELFLVRLDEEERVWYEIRAFSRPGALLARLAYPVVRLLQEKFRQDSAAAMTAFIHKTAPADPSLTPDGWLLRMLLALLFCIGLWPGTIMGHDYGNLPLVFAFFVVTPAVWQLAVRHYPALLPLYRLSAPFLLPAAMLAAAALFLPVGWPAALLSAPWMLLCSGIAFGGLFCLWRAGFSSVRQAVAGAGLAYLFIGGAALLAERGGWTLFEFGAEIVRLTALHFHFAGFALTVLVALSAQHLPLWWSRASAGAVALGVPLTAVGITATQWQLGPGAETFAAVWMALAGLAGAVVWMVLGRRRRNGLLLAGGLVLSAAMLLALGYALRVVRPEWALSLHQMRAIHGSMNGLVAVPLGVLGFWQISRDR